MTISPVFFVQKILAFFFGIMLAVFMLVPAHAHVDIADYPLFVTGISAPPLNMIIMGRDHTLYYEAYNDASDLTGDGVLNVGYQPDKLDYFGYFDSHLCYSYSYSSGRFSPSGSTGNKKCSSGWSGDFLNYITTARIDALRKVLYGGHRIVDTQGMTVLERSYIPQDAHSWGKEYESIARDGYDIRDYTPLSLPTAGTRHLFANTTLLKDDVMAPNRSADMAPLMRVLTNSRFRIWEWVAIERHVAGSRCLDGRNNNNPCVYDATTLRHSHPLNASQFQNLITEWATETQKCGSGPISGGNINTTGSNNNPFASAAHCRQDYYLTIIEGQIYAPVAGEYQFATNGDDAVEFRVNGEVVSYWYGGHGSETGTPDQIATAINAKDRGHNGTVTLAAGWHDFEFRHEERAGGDSYQLLWQRPGQSWAIVPEGNLRLSAESPTTAPTITTYSTERNVPASQMTDYVVRVQVCNESYPDANCKAYPAGSLKPVGLLQQYGENERMLFGLITGSYTHPYNMRGGILRKNIESFEDEIDLETGIFDTSIKGIVYTLNQMRIVDFDASTNYEYRGGWLNDRSMGDSSRQFPDWGNPIAEMMYESLRYFSGKENPTSQFMPSLSGGMENITVRHGADIQLPAPDWIDPYSREDNPALYCSPGAQLVISDVNPSFDTEFVPGSAFSSFSGDISGLNAASEAQAIWNQEHGGSSLHFIGELAGNPDGTPSPKTVSSLGNIRGLAPAEPTKRGGYYSAAIARYAFENDLRDDLQAKQNIHTFAVALASPLPKIEIPVSGQMVTVVPFAKSVGQGATDWTDRGFQPTSTIVDFFVDTFANTDPHGSDADPSVNDGRPLVRFRINYEDVEQGADHDMDAIVLYELRVNADDTLTVELTSEYAAGHTIIHMGYVISGTSADGVYLEVRDLDPSSVANPVNFAFDTPPGLLPGACAAPSPPAACSEPLPFVATRTFTTSTTPAATLLENPLWYAAKYGSEGTRTQGVTSPNYFLVTNASTLQQQLDQAFRRILLLGELSTTSASASTASLRTDTLLYSALFRTDDWSGNFLASEIDTDGSLKTGASCQTCWDAEALLADRLPTNRLIFTRAAASPIGGKGGGVPLLWSNLHANQQTALGYNTNNEINEDISGQDRLAWLRGTDHIHLRFRDPEYNAEEHAHYINNKFNNSSKKLRRLGDIVNSDPIYHNGVLYVAANDGKLHAFDAQTGEELFAYVPSELLLPRAGSQYAYINHLMEPNYTHRYFMDGKIAVVHSAGKDILVGSMGAGGRTVFALDITTPKTFAANHVLWEFTHNALGYNVGRPQTARLDDNDGTWVAVFGNGYNSHSHKAGLFVVDLHEGSLIQHVDTGLGSNANPNGLATPFLTDWPKRNMRIQRVYAGDLQGNLWRFELIGNKNTWSGDILFETQGPNGSAQPITARPLLASLNNEEAVVVIGTGSAFRNNDRDIPNAPVQSIYGIFETANKQPKVSGREFLLEQTIESYGVRSFDGEVRKVRYISDNEPNPEEDPPLGWYIDLNKEDGERVITGPRRSGDTVRISSLYPNEDPCSSGVNGFLTILDLRTGGRTEKPPFISEEAEEENGGNGGNGANGGNGEDIPADEVTSTDIPGSGGQDAHCIRPVGLCDEPEAFEICYIGNERRRVTIDITQYCRQSWQQLR